MHDLWQQRFCWSSFCCRGSTDIPPPRTSLGSRKHRATRTEPEGLISPFLVNLLWKQPGGRGKLAGSTRWINATSSNVALTLLAPVPPWKEWGATVHCCGFPHSWLKRCEFHWKGPLGYSAAVRLFINTPRQRYLPINITCVNSTAIQLACKASHQIFLTLHHWS